MHLGLDHIIHNAVKLKLCCYCSTCWNVMYVKLFSSMYQTIHPMIYCKIPYEPIEYDAEVRQPELALFHCQVKHQT